MARGQRWVRLAARQLPAPLALPPVPAAALACEAAAVAFIPYWPLGGAALVADERVLPNLAERERRIRRAAADIASARAVTVAQVALAWLLARSPVMLPIPGTSSIAPPRGQRQKPERCV